MRTKRQRLVDGSDEEEDDDSVDGDDDDNAADEHKNQLVQTPIYSPPRTTQSLHSKTLSTNRRHSTHNTFSPLNSGPSVI